MAVQTSQRPLRADATRNRALLLEAAAAAFAEEGFDVSVNEIARRAGVGHGTAFRHFPTKDDLIAAILLQRLEDVERLAEEVMADEPDAGQALRRLIIDGAAKGAEDRCYGEAISGPLLMRADVRAAHVRAIEAGGRVLERAQAAGAVRGDITAEDLPMLIKGATLAAAFLQAERPDLWRRYVELMFDALRPQSATALSVPPPTLGQIDAALERLSAYDA